VQYDHPYKGTLDVIRVGPEIMGKLCPKSSFSVTLGCIILGRDECAIIMLRDDLIRE
jgi:hypothetical protein